ncbi:MAG: hypothetical protein AAF799_02965 [Myxococcota bacterium]
MLKKLAIALLLLVLVVAGVLGWLWHRATELPEWYTEQSLEEYAGQPVREDGTVAPPQWIALDEQGQRLPQAEPELAPSAAPPPVDAQAEGAPATAQPSPRKRRRAEPNPAAKRHELRGFHVRRGKDGRPRSSPAIKASRASYESRRLEIGVILDLSRLPRDKLKKRDRIRYQRAVDNFPGITDRDVWVGVEDEPISVGGYLQLSPEAEVRIGSLTYSLASAAERMGMSSMELRLELNRELRRLGFVDPEGRSSAD